MRRSRAISLLAQRLVADQGGHENCSAIRKELIERFCSLAILCRAMERRIARGDEVGQRGQGRGIDLSEYVAAVGALNRLASRLGLSRRARRIETLQDLMTEAAVCADDSE